MQSCISTLIDSPDAIQDPQSHDLAEYNQVVAVVGT